MKPSDLNLGVPRETEAALRDFVALLLRWNARINLTAERDEAAIWQRHVVDSLQLAPLVPAMEGPLVDLGSGAGFPGLMLALTTGRETHLVESDRRKSAFLIEAARVLNLPRMKVHPTRIEAATLPPAAILTARALAPLADLLPHAHRILAPGGTALFPKGRTAEQELTDAARGWIMHIERFASRTEPSATILRLSEIRPAGFHA
ncbi:16S rRNA (guanine(527)-N(7))-methyltransferase RsmG [Roseicella aerolata]|uniref:Ribosomal RNA small subunit methyltransferase G n=1 Tax=Roseicella aerolata TaxID=2883479 RepID=A0A9X1IHV0_9PROT|nr:16S rRNA (guanine(527)-N(7))-methyltransferase RsmG [Roseicella aerolata]